MSRRLDYEKSKLTTKVQGQTVYYRMSSYEEEQSFRRRQREEAELDAMIARDVARWGTPKNNLPKPPKKYYGIRK